MAQWKEITTTEEWSHWLSQTEERPMLVMKHSTRCPVSADAFQEYETFLAEDAPEDVVYLFVKVIESRDVSNRIADDVGVKHQSPQAILIRNGAPVWNRSHWHITRGSLKEALEQ
ncbi:bacillithiol system redox-active protein YtxJ [Desmospora profundinema]|uniref:Bacillithiol system protein YtxJ n=1 Tax=Desmospora profundinema TaxID=1571184 RepID=A0ABU1IRV7_9BACL|nr:bacillithiol system redox-active protein YtxJ [Desmospora profundinema]MDR6227421.1 bacillithiol system protein YtxJ [Desmospora profundinema]